MRWRGARRVAFATLAILGLAVSGARAAEAPFGDPAKVLRVVFVIAETGFDPQAVGDLYSNYVNRVIFEPLYRYDYLARPWTHELRSGRRTRAARQVRLRRSQWRRLARPARWQAAGRRARVHAIGQ
jgi:hypothetical protein